MTGTMRHVILVVAEIGPPVSDAQTLIGKRNGPASCSAEGTLDLGRLNIYGYSFLGFLAPSSQSCLKTLLKLPKPYASITRFAVSCEGL